MEFISSSNVLDPRLVERVAAELLTSPGLVEKDWHVVRAIGVLAAIDHGDAKPAFSGGTSLSKAWDLIKRFSEDIDFKVAIPAAASKSKDRTRRQDYRSLVITALQGAGFELDGDVMKADVIRHGKRTPMEG
jgi:predicted nucleotidyltransferase component of viral defense system